MTSLLDKITQASMKTNKLLLKNDVKSYLVTREGLRKVIPANIQPRNLDKLAFRIEEQDKKDRDLLIKNDQIGKRSQKRNQQVKTLSKISEQMIQDIEEQPKGFEYIDEDGVKRFKRYDTSVEVPDLEEDDGYVRPEVLENVLIEIEDTRQQFLEQYNNKLERYEYLVTEEQYYARLLNEGKISMEDFKYETKYILAEMDALIYELAELQHEIDVGANQAKKQFEEEINERNRSIKLLKERNKEKIRTYQDSLNALNASAFRMEQLPSETEQEYLQRLQQNALVDLPEDILEESRQKANILFRRNMQDITKNQVIIEQVANSFVEEPEKKFELNKIWNLVVSKFKKIYGSNSKVDADTIIEFLNGLIRKMDSDLPIAVEQAIYSEEPILDQGKIHVEQIDTSTIELKKPTMRGEPPLYFRAVLVHRRGDSKYALLYSFTNEIGSFKEYFDEGVPNDRKMQGVRGKIKSSKEIKDKTGITVPDLYEALGEDGKGYTSLNGSSYCKKLIRKFNISPIEVQDTIQSSYKSGINKPQQVEYGMGIHKQHEPKLIPFGQVSILYNKLKNENTLAIKTHQGKSIGGLPNKKISKKLASIIMDLIEGMHPTHDELTRLDKSDRIIYDKVVYLGKLHTDIPHTNETTINDLKKRLKLLEGEIEIGNNSPQLKQEINEIIKNLILFKTITPKQGKDYLKQI